MSLMMTTTNPILVNHNSSIAYTDWVCGSCGCRIEEADGVDNFLQPGMGITIYSGKHSDAYEDEWFKLEHIETSAGPITVVLNLKKEDDTD